MADPMLDLIVGDADPAALAAGYLLALQGRSVGIVDLPPPGGTATLPAAVARRFEPLRPLVDDAPVVSRRSAKVLQPEGMLGVEFASERLLDARDAVVVVDRSAAFQLLTNAITERGGRIVPGGGSPAIDESGFVAGYRSPDGSIHPARCSILGDVDAEWVGGVPLPAASSSSWAVESEWRYALGSDLVAARFGLDDGGSAEWWLQGDPFEGASALGVVRAFRETIILAVVVPLAEVLARELSIEALAARLGGHAMIAPLFFGAELIDVAGRTIRSDDGRREPGFGDGWVASPRGAAGDLTPLKTELLMAEVLAGVIEEALATPRVSAARFSAIPRRIRAITAARTLPFSPIDAWADELVSDPTALMTGVRLLAERFGSAG